MTKVMPLDPPIPPGFVIDEAEHYFKCPLCGGYFDERDYAAVLDHQEPLPHPAGDRVQ